MGGRGEGNDGGGGGKCSLLITGYSSDARFGYRHDFTMKPRVGGAEFTIIGFQSEGLCLPHRLMVADRVTANIEVFCEVVLVGLGLCNEFPAWRDQGGQGFGC